MNKKEREKAEEKIKKEIDNILNPKLPIEHWEFSLGVGYTYENAPPGVKFSAPYLEIGKELWEAFQVELIDFLCVREEKKPKKWVNELITGDTRNLAVGLVTAISAEYSISIGIAVPVVALILKRKVTNFCKIEDKRELKGKNLKQLLNRKKG